MLGLSEKEVRRLIKRRRLLLTHGGLRVAALYARSGADLRFYGEAIDSIYTVQNVYWLEFGAGLEMERSRAKGARPTEAVQTFTDTVTTEEDNLAALLLGTSPEDDVWYWNYLSAGGSSADYPLGVPGATAIGTVTLRAHLHGSTDLSPGDDHLALASLNGEPVGQVQSGWHRPPNTRGGVRLDAAGQNDPNTVTLQALKPDGKTLSVVWVDRFETIYQRSMSALDDALVLRGDDNPTVTVHGFSTRRITVLDIADPLQPKIVKRARVRDRGRRLCRFLPAGTC